MTDVQRHIERAEHNERLYLHLHGYSPQYNDWEVTVLFYASLHYVKAYAAHKQVRIPTSHEGIWDLIGKESFLKREIFHEYAELQNRSEDARYKLIRIPPAEHLYSIEFRRVKERIRKAIGV